MRFQFTDDRGIAIVAVTMVLVVAALLGGTLIAQTSQDMRESERTYHDKQSLYLAESAIERAYYEIKANSDGFGSFFNTVTQTGETQPGTISNVDALKGGTYTLQVVELRPLVPLEYNQIVQITGTGNTGTGRSRQVIVVAEVIRENLSVWNNAIFGGSGSTGGVIEGNAQIYGSVNLLGDNVGEGAAAIEALDMSGASIIYNNYGEVDTLYGISSELNSKLPPLPQTDGTGLYTLDAKLRVKNGAVGISGSSQIGQDQTDASLYGAEGPMNGIYIETSLDEVRWTGNAVVDGDPKSTSVYSDNGYDALYDVSDVAGLQMPLIEGQEYYDVGTDNTYSSYDTFFDNIGDPDDYRCLEINLPGGQSTLTLDETASGQTTIAASTWTGSSPPVFATAGSGFTLTAGPNEFSYDPMAVGGPRLTVKGMVRINGNLVLGQGTGSAKPITYTNEHGTIFAAGTGARPSGNITVRADVLPAGTFPTDAALGLVAGNRMYLGQPGDANMKVAAALYAERYIRSSLENEIAGTFVSQYFDMGTAVPSIFQVPTLPYNLPPGLPGAAPIWWVTGFEQKSWRTEFEPAEP
jgi:hypothetical protein